MVLSGGLCPGVLSGGFCPGVCVLIPLESGGSEHHQRVKRN